MGATNNKIPWGVLALALWLPLAAGTRAAAAPAKKAGTPVEFQFDGGIEMKNGALVALKVRISYQDMVLTAAEARTTDSFENGGATFHGEVTIVSPRGNLHGEDANVVVRDGRVVSAVITGAAAAPATFEETAQNSKTQARGRAQTIEYDPATETVHLKTGVWFSRNINNTPAEFTGDDFTYNTATGDLKGGPARGTITSLPKDRREDKTTTP